MPITVDWYNSEKTVLLYTYRERWTWTDFDTAVIQGNSLMESVPYTVHVIVDMHDSSLIPTDVISTSNRQRITKGTPHNHGKLIVYGISPALQLLASTVQRIAPQWVADRNAVIARSAEEINEIISSATLLS
jgi:hypothetical protein